MGDRQQTTVVAPSGRAVTFSWETGAALSGQSASVVYLVNGVPTGFQIGSSGYFDTACQFVVSAEVRQRLVHDGMEFVLATSADGLVTLVGAKGPFHEVVKVFTGPPPPLERILDKFSQFSIKDSERGCRMVPRPGALYELESETIALAVRERGAVIIPDTRAARGLIPPGEGTATSRGEIWRLTLGDPPATPNVRDYSYILGTPTGAAQVSVDPSTDVSDDLLMDWLDTLDVAWL